MTSCGTRIGTRNRSAMYFVICSTMTTRPRIGQNRPPLGLLLPIFFALLAGDAQPRVWERIEPVEVDVLAAAVALAERLGRAVHAAKCLVDVPQEPALLPREEERLLALHRVRPLIGHVERVAAQVAIGVLRGRAERLIVVAEFLQHSLALLEQSLLEVLQLLLGHRLGLLGAGRCWHR